jgi:hypothetical protein
MCVEPIARDSGIVSLVAIGLIIVLLGACTEAARRDYPYDAREGYRGSCEYMADEGYRPVVDPATNEFLKCEQTWENAKQYNEYKNCLDSDGKPSVDRETGAINCEVKEAE